MIQKSQTAYRARWGIDRHYSVYFGPDAEVGSLADTIDIILNGARQGHRFTLLLHRRHYSAFRKMGWNGLHTNIELLPLSLLFPLRNLQQKILALRSASPDMLSVRGCSETTFPGSDAALSRDELFSSFMTTHLQPQVLSGAMP
jgi:hypothetical protein